MTIHPRSTRFPAALLGAALAFGAREASAFHTRGAYTCPLDAASSTAELVLPGRRAQVPVAGRLDVEIDGGRVEISRLAIQLDLAATSRGNAGSVALVLDSSIAAVSTLRPFISSFIVPAGLLVTGVSAEPAPAAAQLFAAIVAGGISGTLNVRLPAASPLAGAAFSLELHCRPAPGTESLRVEIETGPVPQHRPAVAYNFFDLQYLVVYEELEPVSGKHFIAGRILALDGSLVLGPFPISAVGPADRRKPSVAFKYHSPGLPRRYFVAWENEDGFIEGAQLDQLGLFLQSPARINPPGSFGAGPDVATGPEQRRPFMVAYRGRQDVPPRSTVRLARIDVTGFVVRDEQIAVTGPVFGVDPSDRVWNPHIAYGHSGLPEDDQVLLSFVRPETSLARRVGLVAVPATFAAAASGEVAGPLAGGLTSVAYSGIAPARWALAYSVTDAVTGGPALKVQLGVPSGLGSVPFFGPLELTLFRGNEFSDLPHFDVSGSNSPATSSGFLVVYTTVNEVFGNVVRASPLSILPVPLQYTVPDSARDVSPAVALTGSDPFFEPVPVFSACNFGYACALVVWEHEAPFPAGNHDILGFAHDTTFPVPSL